uniref:Uncharacterized protein n=1 Tax=Arundo donax TaxID=35708 RepID=A0A0A9DW92_ARUDO
MTHCIRQYTQTPRRFPSEEKPLQKIGGSKIKTTSRMKADSRPKPETKGSRSPPTIATKAGDQKARNSVSMNNIVKVSPTCRTSVTTIGSSWESLSSGIQSLGLVLFIQKLGSTRALLYSHIWSAHANLFPKVVHDVCM